MTRALELYGSRPTGDFSGPGPVKYLLRGHQLPPGSARRLIQRPTSAYGSAEAGSLSIATRTSPADEPRPGPGF